MPSHIHFIWYSENGNLSNTLRDFKSFTANQLLKAIAEHPQESRKEWMLKLFCFYGKQSAQKQKFQFWKYDNHPFFLYTNKMIQQRLSPLRATHMASRHLSGYVRRVHLSGYWGYFVNKKHWSIC
jgi:putative transposase